jgi:hypothetical protein
MERGFFLSIWHSLTHSRNYPSFRENRSFITVFIRTATEYYPESNPVHIFPTSTLTSVLIFHCTLRPPTRSLPCKWSGQVLCMRFISLSCVLDVLTISSPYPPSFVHPYNMKWRVLITCCNFLHPAVIFSLLGSNIPRTALSSETS